MWSASNLLCQMPLHAFPCFSREFRLISPPCMLCIERLPQYKPSVLFVFLSIKRESGQHTVPWLSTLVRITEKVSKTGVGASIDEKFTNTRPVASVHSCLLRRLQPERLATLPLWLWISPCVIERWCKMAIEEWSLCSLKALDLLWNQIALSAHYPLIKQKYTTQHRACTERYINRSRCRTSCHLFFVL